MMAGDSGNLLATLKRLDVRLEPRGDRLRVDAPAGTITPDLREAMITHKVELLALLAGGRAPTIIEHPGQLSPDWRIEWEERAAIREIDGGLLREHAEYAAFREILDRMRAGGD